MNKTKIFALMLSSLFTQLQLSYSQSSMEDLYADFSVPDLTAYSLLGINTNAVHRPGNVKEFSSSLLTMVSTAPNLYPGIAIEYTPAYTKLRNLESRIAALKNNERKFIDDFYRRADKNFQISLGTGTDTTGGNLAFGLKWSYDWGDQNKNDCYLKTYVSLYPKYTEKFSDFYNQTVRPIVSNIVLIALDKKLISASDTSGIIANVLRVITDELNPSDYISSSQETTLKSITKAFEDQKLYSKGMKETVNSGIAEMISTYKHLSTPNSNFNKKVEEFKESYTKKMWNNKAIAFAIGNIWNAPSNLWKDLHFSRLSWFISYAQPLFKPKHLRTQKNPESTDCKSRMDRILNSKGFGILSVWQLQGNVFYSPADSTSDFMISPGARFILGHNDFRVSAEGMYTYVSNRSVDNSHHVRSTLGIEFRIGNGLWLEFAMGFQGPTNKLDQSSILSLGNIKYAIQSKRRFGL